MYMTILSIRDARAEAARAVNYAEIRRLLLAFPGRSAWDIIGEDYVIYPPEKCRAMGVFFDHKGESCVVQEAGLGFTFGDVTTTDSEVRDGVVRHYVSISQVRRKTAWFVCVGIVAYRD